MATEMATEIYGVVISIPTNPGSSVPIDIGIDGYATFNTLLEHDTELSSLMGIIEIGSPR
jgi:hypothetical protein